MAKFDSLDSNLDNLFTQLEQEKNLPVGLLKSVAYTESRYNPTAKSSAGASGMFQFMPATAKQYNVDVNDPVSSAKGAAQMYADLLKQNNGDLNRALAGYNWGQGNLQKQGMERLPKETQNYISQINNLMNNKPSSEKKNSLDDIPPEALQAYNEYQEQMGKKNSQPNIPDDIPPEALQAYNEYQAKMGKNKSVYMPENQANNEQLYGIVKPQAVAQPQEQKQDIYANIFKDIVARSEAGEDFTPLWNNLNEKEKKYVGRYLEGAYQQNPEKTGVIQNLFQGLANSAQKGKDSIEQIGNYSTFNKDNINRKNEEVARNQAMREIENAQNPSIARSIGEFAGDALQFIGGSGVARAGMSATSRAVPGLIVKGGSNMARAADLAAQGAAANVLQNPVVNAQNPEETNFIQDKLTQAGIGAVAGAGLGLPLEKAIGAVGGRISKVNQARTAPLSAEDEAFIANAESKNIPWFANDLPSATEKLNKRAQQATLKNETMAEKVTEQQRAVTKNIKDFDDNLAKVDRDEILEETSVNKILKDNTSAYHDDAVKLKEKIDKLDMEDHNAVVKVASEARLLGAKQESNKLYKEVEKLLPDSKIEVENILKTADIIKKEIDDITLGSQKSKLSTVIKDIDDTLKKVQNGNLDYVKSNQIMRDLGNSISDLKFEGNKQGARLLTNFKDSLERDQDAFINSVAKGSKENLYKTAYNKAKEFNRENVQKIQTNDRINDIFDMRDKSNKDILSDKTIDKFIKKGEIERAKEIYEFLPNSAKKAVSKSMMNKLTSNAYDADGDIIPKNILSNYRALQDKTTGKSPLEVILEPNALKTFKNLMETMGSLKNIGFNKANPINGYQNDAVLQGIDAMSTVTAAKATGGASLLRPLTKFMNSRLFVKGLTDPKLKRMFINLNNLNPSKPAYTERANEIATYLSGNYLIDKVEK